MTRQEVPPLLTLSRAVLATQWVRVGHNTLSYRYRRPVSQEKKKKSRCLIFGTRTILPEMHVKITFFRSSARCGSTFFFRKNGFVRCAASSVFRVTFSVRGEVCSLCASSCHVALSGVVFVVSSRRGSKHAENMSVMAGKRSMGSYVEGVGGGRFVSCWSWACRPGVRRAPSFCFFAEWSRRRPPLSVQCLRQLGSSMGCSAGQDGVVSDSMHGRWFFLMS